MALDPEFIADCPYGPEAVPIDEIVEINEEEGIIRAVMPTHAELPLTRDQRAHPVRHPRHVSGGFMVHLTGMLGFNFYRFPRLRVVAAAHVPDDHQVGIRRHVLRCPAVEIGVIPRPEAVVDRKHPILIHKYVFTRFR